MPAFGPLVLASVRLGEERTEKQTQRAAVLGVHGLETPTVFRRCGTDLTRKSAAQPLLLAEAAQSRNAFDRHIGFFENPPHRFDTDFLDHAGGR